MVADALRLQYMNLWLSFKHVVTAEVYLKEWGRVLRIISIAVSRAF